VEIKVKVKNCSTCLIRDFKVPSCCDCGLENHYKNWEDETKAKQISFPILNNLTPNLGSCTKKVLEEIGELMQLLGKGQGESGETTVERLNNQSEWVRRTAEEALDSAQSLVTLVCVLLDEPNDREIAMQRHVEKLKSKGYLK